MHEGKSTAPRQIWDSGFTKTRVKYNLLKQRDKEDKAKRK